MKMAQELSDEAQRAISEGLNEEELAVFDILTKPEMSLTDKEKQEVKKVAKSLLETLKRERNSSSTGERGSKHELPSELQ